MSQSFALCSEGGKFSTTTERSRICEGEYKKNNSGHNTRKGEDGRSKGILAILGYSILALIILKMLR